MHNDFNRCTTVTGRNEIGGLAHPIAVSFTFAFSFSRIGQCSIYANQCGGGHNEKRSEPRMGKNTMIERGFHTRHRPLFPLPVRPRVGS